MNEVTLVNFYIKLILANRKTIEEVPLNLKEEVAKELNIL